MGFVRAKAPDGAEFTIDENAAKRMGVEILEKPAVDANNRPLSFKPATTKAGQPKASATEKKEA